MNMIEIEKNEYKHFCKRCLLAETGEAEIFKSIVELINTMPEEKKTDKETYERRLALCSECGELYGGMCRQCGCYVELRAIKINMHCPDVNSKW